MIKKDFYIIGSIIVLAILVAYIINISLSYGDLISTNLTTDSWLNFWGGYCGGAFAAIVGYLAIIYSNRNSEKAINQQYNLLKEQDRRKQINDYNECLKHNLELLNVVTSKGFTTYMSPSDSTLAKKEIANKKSQIYSYDLQLRYIFQFDTKQNKSEIERKYYECWIKSRQDLSDLLDKQMDIIFRMEQNRSDWERSKILQKIIYNARQLLKIEKDIIKIEEYKNDEVNARNELTIILVRIDRCTQDIDDIMKMVDSLSFSLLSNSKELFDLSILLMKEKESIL